MEIVMPRAFSSGALSIWSNGVNATVGSCSCSTLVIAAVNVVFPWSICPIVPIFKCGFVRSNFLFAMGVRSPLLLPADLRDDVPGDALWHLGVAAEVHCRRGPALRH